ncbi:alpha-glucosidase [Candidatus Epulonipiscium viviparus]|uniref:alpha-glucosidase n=1 Tax=Candidatus Epulonipiscium viviparus TaxID=420336 RepID=UPI00016C05A2|nr:alpha-glucosidase [Candidatus Epulopiscium viviparus]
MFENKVIYQIYPKSFNDTTGNGYGDINGIIEKLDYIQDLGVDYIWLSPCCMSPQKDNGYDISDYVTIDPLFGTNEDYQRLITQAKARGMKIMMDLVLNHTSSEHEWFKKALQKDPKYYDYYIWQDAPNAIESFFGGSAWTYSKEVGKYYLHLFDSSQPDLNWANPAVRKDIYDMINYWIDKGVEGFRLDVIYLIGKEPDKLITGHGPKFIEYLKELNENTFQDKLLTVGECWGTSLEEQYKMCHDKGLSEAFHFNHFLLNTVDGKDKWHTKELDLKELCDCFDTWQNEYTGVEALVTGSHDAPRMISRWLNDTQYRMQSSKLLITLFGLMAGDLYIYQGEEIGMTNAHWHDINKYNDVETLNAYELLKEQGFDEKTIMEKIAFTSRDNARVPMQWNDTSNAGFTTGNPWLDVVDNYTHVNALRDLTNELGVYKYYQKVIKFRKEHYDWIKQKAKFSEDNGVLKMEKPKFTLVANFTDQKQAHDLGSTGDVLFNNYSKVEKQLMPYQVVVVCNK